jgi:atypical dual specificity phosphatase
MQGNATAVNDNSTSGYPTANATIVDDSLAYKGQMTLPSGFRPRILKPRFLMLVGLPGSGKSTFSEQLVKSGRGWVRICQDELQGRDEFENGIGRIAKDTSKCLVLDRTNVKKADRKAFLGLAFGPKDAVCIHFDVPPDECEKRVANRTDHPTIRYGGGRGAVRSMHDSFEMPSCDEGFAEVITVRTFADAEHLLQCWGAEAPQVAPMGFSKFPTTPHVLDLTKGKALTESDRLLTPAEAAQFYDGKTVVIAEEKIDGANVGISLTENYEPRYQNRSHYVSSGYATQWKALDSWWNDNGWAICQLLEPEVEILFGEWVWARHSVHYNKLPAYFVAFDIYNKKEGRFVSARVRDQRLDGLGIPVVPRLNERTFSSKEDIIEFLNMTSAYGEGPLEGVYLRIDDSLEEGNGLWHKRRGKIVRSDFIQVIEEGGHWIHRDVERNQLSYD